MTRFLLILFTLILVGCATPPEKLTPSERKQIYYNNQEKLQLLGKWQLSGRLAFHYERGGDTLNIDWIQFYDDFGVKLSGPLNVGAAYLIGGDNGVTYKDGKGNEDHAPSAEAILQAYTGYLLPISSLRFWVIGRPDPAMLDDETLSPQGYPIQMRQGAWTIDYGYFHPVGEFVLPSKLTLHHPDFSVTLSIHQWELNNLRPVGATFKTKQPAQITPLPEGQTDMQTLNVPNNNGKNAPKKSAPTIQNSDPAQRSSLAGDSFPPKKSPPNPANNPPPKMSNSPPPAPKPPTRGSDLTDTSMHPWNY